MQFYTGGFLGDKFADVKDGAIYPRFGGLCLEAQVNTIYVACWGKEGGGGKGGGQGECGDWSQQYTLKKQKAA